MNQYQLCRAYVTAFIAVMLQKVIFQHSAQGFRIPMYQNIGFSSLVPLDKHLLRRCNMEPNNFVWSNLHLSKIVFV